MQRALILDCDGVIVDSEAIALKVERSLLAGAGLTYPEAEFLSRFVGLHNRDYHAALLKDAEAVGLRLPADLFDQMQAEIWRRFETDLTAITGIDRVVEAFDGPVAVASSSETPKLERKLEMTRLTPLFGQHVYSADLVTHGKPAPDLFLLAADRLEAAPEACLVVEDSVNGIKAANAAGMMGLGFVGGGHADAGLADRLDAAGAAQVFSSHAELARFVSELGL
ncbi:MAG: HAD family phosphatase [Henriciella sp.]|nr:HAD family phosphatase [Henriciella sp.]